MKSKISRREFLKIAGASMVGLALAGRNWENLSVARLPASPANSPNILLISIDALRADRLSVAGYHRPTSPNLDRLAGQGVMFENAYSTSSYSLPSHVSLLTGRYSHEHGAEWYAHNALSTCPFPILSEVLLSQGYRTGGFSANVFWVSREQGFDRGFIHFEDFFHDLPDMGFRTFFGKAYERMVLQRLGIDDIPGRKHATDINRSVLKWAAQNQNHPFFVFINYMDVHDPYLPPEPYRSKFSKNPSPGGILNWRVGRDDPPMSAEEIESESDAYDGSISYVDDQIGQLISQLIKLDPQRELFVIVTSDHGEAFGEHKMFLHANSLHREVIHVPLILSWPGRIPEGMRVSQPISNVLIPSSVINILLDQDPNEFPGPSLANFWNGKNLIIDWPDPIAEIAQQDWQPKKYPVNHGWIRTIINSRWQFIEYETLDPELYDLPNDPKESNNLALKSKYQQRVFELKEKLRILSGNITPRLLSQK